ncbi:glycosyltransferase [Micromonospora aurantiaca (nom. illeg.)]|uniref:glycosyltransferase n=1 Tax=Micromonospora aurantiaca (nom. illeg.) TaxID=47850 RepID=UPI0033F1E9B2
MHIDRGPAANASPWFAGPPGEADTAPAPSSLGQAVRDVVVRTLTEFVTRYAPAFRVPRVFAGFPVQADVHADLAHVLGLLHAGGVTHLAGTPVDEALTTVLGAVDGPRTHTFASYRVAETLRRFGSWADNALLSRLPPERQAHLRAAVDTGPHDAWLDARTPRNYAAVLARCEHARAELGLPVDDAALDDLVARTRALIDETPGRQLDDSTDGSGRFDVYGPALYLVAEPLAARIGPAWEAGARQALDLVELVVTDSGTAVGWGRSAGALARCLTIELAGLVARRPELSPTGPDEWAARAGDALTALRPWFDQGLIQSHRHRSTYAYRGPARRLQMTLDCFGKLLDAANALDAVPVPGPTPRRTRDAVFWFDRDRHAGVWSYRSAHTAFVLPLVGSTVSDYLPAPQWPGLFEVPVDSALAAGVPVAVYDGRTVAPAGLPDEVVHRPGRLEVVHHRWPDTGRRQVGDEPAPVRATRRARYEVRGRTLHVHEELRFDEPPDAVALQVTEAAARPLRVEFAVGPADVVTTVEVRGVKDYRSYFGELPVVHQVELAPATRLDFRWSVTPKLRVASSAYGHHYDALLYAPLRDRVHEVALTRAQLDRHREILAEVDVFHLHWPERLLPPDLAGHLALIDAVRDSGTRLLLTQHNLTPHDRRPEWRGVYQAWAAAADGVIHHSARGRDRACAELPYPDHARHLVIPHGHFGDLMTGIRDDDRTRTEAEFGLRPGVLRLGVIGAPRPEKDVALVIDAVAACDRDDIELLVLSGTPELPRPPDPRIRVVPYELVPRREYNRRLAAIDVLVLPFHDGDMLATGTVADAVGRGLPALVSPWPFLTEMLGGSAIPYGRTRADLTRCLDSLDDARLDRARAASGRLRDAHDWARVAELHLAALESLGPAKL